MATVLYIAGLFEASRLLVSRQFVTVIEFNRFLGTAETVNKLCVIWVVEWYKPSYIRGQRSGDVPVGFSGNMGG